MTLHSAVPPLPKESPHSPLEVRLFIVDDHEVVRHGLAMSLENYLEDNPEDNMSIRIVGSARTAGEALRQIPLSDANIALMDIVLPDMSGMNVIQHLRSLGLGKEQLRILVVTELLSPNLRGIFAAGANGFITKQEQSSVFIEALRAILLNPFTSWLQPEVAQLLVKLEYTLKAYGLTPTEIDVLQLLHLPNPEIAECLHITVGTVRNHLTSIYDKLHINTRKDAVAFARRLGILSSPY